MTEINQSWALNIVSIGPFMIICNILTYQYRNVFIYQDSHSQQLQANPVQMKRKNNTSVPKRLKRRESLIYSIFGFGIIAILALFYMSGCSFSDEAPAADNEVVSYSIVPGIPGLENQQENWKVLLVPLNRERIEIDMKLIMHTDETLKLRTFADRDRSDGNLVMKRNEIVLHIQEHSDAPKYYRGSLTDEVKMAADFEKLTRSCYEGSIRSKTRTYVYAKGAQCAP